MNAEQAFGTLEAYLAGGDELGDVSHDEAADALNTLRLQLDEYKRANRQLVVKKAAVTAERDALKAQLDAVPLNAIALYWEATIVDYGRLAHEDHMKVAKADEAVENWVVEVKYGKRDGWGGTPVTSEYPPDRSMEDADNDRFFEAK